MQSKRPSQKKDPEQSLGFYTLVAMDSDDLPVPFELFRGQPLIIANVASFCGLAKKNYHQFGDLAAMYHSRGLRILLFPCSQFFKQESNDITKVVDFASQYSDKLIVFKYVDVFGKNIHPVFKHLTKYSRGWLGNFIKWNFTKFVINENGVIVKRYGPNEIIDPEDPVLVDLFKDREYEDERTDRKFNGDPYDCIEDSSE